MKVKHVYQNCKSWGKPMVWEQFSLRTEKTNKSSANHIILLLPFLIKTGVRGMPVCWGGGRIFFPGFTCDEGTLMIEELPNFTLPYLTPAMNTSNWNLAASICNMKKCLLGDLSSRIPLNTLPDEVGDEPAATTDAERTGNKWSWL